MGGGAFPLMSWLGKICRWIFRALSIFGSIAPALWGLSIYSGIAYSLYIIIDQTQNLLSNLGTIFGEWAQGWSEMLIGVFESANRSSHFQFFSYVLSLDVPFEWVRSCGDTFLRFWLLGVCGIFISAVEICIVVLGTMWVRSRLKSMASGNSTFND